MVGILFLLIKLINVGICITNSHENGASETEITMFNLHANYVDQTANKLKFGKNETKILLNHQFPTIHHHQHAKI